MIQPEDTIWDWKDWIERMRKENKFGAALDELRAERRATQQKLEELDRLIEGLEGIANKNGGTPIASTVVMHPSEFVDKSIAHAAIMMIRRANRPLHARDITEGLKAGGYPFRSDKQLASVTAVMWGEAQKKGGPIMQKGKNAYFLKHLDE